MNSLLDWFDSRTGFRHLMHEGLYENVPGGARFRYVTGSMLVFAFVTQAVTGMFLWMAYSPSSQTAYESVWWIQYRMTGGWLLRGIHHFMAQGMVIVLGLHLLQVVVDGAYRKPREVNYWLGLVLMQLVLGLGLTGYLLPWDQKGYWATSVATNLTTLVPGVGKELQQVAIGGGEYGHHTLTRFFALHAGILPALLVGFLALHIAVFRKHGITAHVAPGRADEAFWPKQVLFDAIGCLVLLTIVLGFVIHWDFAGLWTGNLPLEHRGAELGAPSDPSEQYSAARPEWYFLFLFQLLKYFPGSSEVIGAIVIPGIAFGILALMPFIGRSRAGHRLNVAFLLLLLVGSAALTLLALREDYFVLEADRLGYDKVKYSREVAASQEFLAAKEEAEHHAARMYELVNRVVEKDDGTLSEPLNMQKQGAVYLLRNDPLTQGPKLFGRHCASCHDYRPPGKSSDSLAEHGPTFVTLQTPKVDGKGKVVRDAGGNPVYDDAVSGAPNLYGFGTVRWIERLLDHEAWQHAEFGKPAPSTDPATAANENHPDNHKRPAIADYFGNTAHKEGDMADYLAGDGEALLYETKDGQRVPTPARHKIAVALAAQAQRPPRPGEAPLDKQDIAEGIALIQENCTACHRFGGEGELGSAPDLTGYGSYEWMMGLVSDPTNERFYRDDNDRMPSFALDLQHPQNNNVSAREISLIVDWLSGQYYRNQDGHRLLPHDEETARRTMADARRTQLPQPEVIAEPVAATRKP
jgi:quinol-cytochrome oxidoreductase complex cytochrome b subunit/mono/diheme cytochrome c family protein